TAVDVDLNVAALVGCRYMPPYTLHNPRITLSGGRSIVPGTELHLYMPVGQYLQAILRQSWIARFLENALIVRIRPVPSDYRFHREMRGRIERNTIENNNSSLRSIKQSGCIASRGSRYNASAKAGLSERDFRKTTNDVPVVSFSRCVFCDPGSSR